MGSSFMKLIKYKWLLLCFIVVIAVFTRFHQLGNNTSLTWDEVSWGYNAYALGVDGKDEFGRFLPLNYLESFGDFKPPMYAYLAVVPVKIFGLNALATRFPSALFGVATVFLAYFLVKRIFWKSENKEYYALASSLFLAISPWHIMLSRAAFEANVSTFFIVVGVWSFLAAVQNKKWYLLISAVSFVACFYTFNTGRIVAPLLAIFMAVMFHKELFKNKFQVTISVVLGVLLLLPILGFITSAQAGLRYKEVNIFSDLDIVKTSNQEIANDNGAFWSKIIHNRRLLYATAYVTHYFDNLNPSFLFIKGDRNPKFSTQNVGQMYFIDIIFFVGGILFLFRKREGNWWLIPAWLLIGLIPAATARETPHALRTETALPMFQILAAYGFVQIVELFKKRKQIVFGAMLILLFANFVYFYHDLMANYNYINSREWQHGYVDSINYVESVQDKYDQILVDQSLDRPYIYYLFYTQTNPQIFRENSDIERDSFGFVEVSRIGKYSFPKSFDYEKDKGENILYIRDPEKLPENAKVLKTFYLLNGEPILKAFTL